MIEELYFCLHLTENEHYLVEDELRGKAQEYGAEMMYYRVLKEGHVPMYREVKFRGDKPAINRLKKYIKSWDYCMMNGRHVSFSLINHVERNPHKEN